MSNEANSFLSVFEGRRVFITGHTGFKGSWLVTWLHLLGADVTGYALAPEREYDHFVELGLDRRIRHIEGDIRDAAKLREAMEKARPEFVFHLAAQPLVGRSYRDPKSTFDINIGGSVNLLEAVRASKTVRSLVYTTSDKCYQPQERTLGYEESDPLGGKDPYSASKACAELVLSSYQSSFLESTKVTAASVRAGNVIGGGDWSEDRIVPDCVRALSGGRPIALRNPKAIRPWQHVLEPLAGYLRLASLLAGPRGSDYRGGWNFGPAAESHRTVSELAELATSTWGGVKLAATKVPAQFAEAQLLYLNCAKARRALGWNPVWDFSQTVEQTVEWYKQALNGADVWELSTWQLQAYCALLRETPRAAELLEGPAA